MKTYGNVSLRDHNVCSANKVKSEAKQQELHAQLKLSRLQQQQQQLTQNQQESSSLKCKDTDEKVVGVQRRLETMQVLAKHRLERFKIIRSKENAEVLLQEEMIKQRKISFNKKRSTFREEQRERKN